MNQWINESMPEAAPREAKRREALDSSLASALLCHARRWVSRERILGVGSGILERELVNERTNE